MRVRRSAGEQEQRANKMIGDLVKTKEDAEALQISDVVERYTGRYIEAMRLVVIFLS
ncbi:MAG TPA: hypothetical protein H9671_09785 [Firmicutes bacterium]|nr:hypothetical protein [Bacillota bacterium]